MLTGLAHAQAGQFIDAERAFRQGEQSGAPLLDALPSACAVTQMIMLVPRDERDAFSRVACASASPVLEHFWWLPDPLWSIPGNERYVWDISATGLSMRETGLRYNWPNYTFWPSGQFEGQLANQID